MHLSFYLSHFQGLQTPQQSSGTTTISSPSPNHRSQRKPALDPRCPRSPASRYIRCN
ncbi:hypothetical protein M758_UG222000 [Ceratodon purpureus]|nr:hypothetical protein M758_UG222000 [Ceratodon purpureus]